jgi:two-component system chemotaxis response regulator CheB
MKKYKAVVIGVSAGGMKVLTRLLSMLPENFSLPLMIVQHLHPSQSGFYIRYFNEKCALTVKEADEKERIQAGYVYFAPPNYHLLIEEDHSFSLSSDEKVNFSRPSIDVLFESAVDAYHSDLIGIILTGANNDGASGLQLIKHNGGLTLVQNPSEAESPTMPRSAIAAGGADAVLSVEEIGNLLIRLDKNNKR